MDKVAIVWNEEYNSGRLELSNDKLELLKKRFKGTNVSVYELSIVKAIPPKEEVFNTYCPYCQSDLDWRGEGHCPVCTISDSDFYVKQYNGLWGKVNASSS